MSEKEYIVTLNKGVDYDAFNAEMIASTGAGDIPNRTVDVADARPGSLRNTHYALTDAEAAALRNDSRVVDVQIPPQDRDDIEIGFNAYQSGVWTRDTVTQQSNLNWGNLRCTRIEDPWNGNTLTDISDDYKYTLTGRGVDVVIQDSGIQPTHYQFTNDLGLSRVKQIDWYAASGVSGTQSANFYRDYNGHGSHCAGTVAGRTLGWAREADIYAVKVSGLEGSGDSGTGISVSNCFDVITGWHNNKPIDPKTGFKRPTVVNASWGYSGNRTGTLTGGVYNGQSWSTGSGQPWPDTEASHLEYAGIHGKYFSLGTARRINVRVASVDADLQDAIDAGVIFCIAAGNSYYYIDSATGPNWNDTADFGAGQENIFRGSSPYDTEAFMVGNIDNTYYNSKEQKAESSCFGPGVDINAPGTYIMSCASSDKGGACDLTDGTEATISTVNDPGTNNNLDPLMKISGTSMASPQVAGMIACILQANPGMTPAQMKTYIHNNSLQDLLWEDTNHTLVADTFTASTTVANGTSDYTFTAGSDRNGAISGNDPNITIYQGDTIEITNSIGAHPLYIKTVSGVADTNNQVTTPAATGQGATNGTVSWTPALPGRFYYQCSAHANMWGQIEVLPRVDWNNLDNIGDGPNRFLYSGLFATGDNLRVKGPVRWGQEKIVAAPGGGGGSVTAENSIEFNAGKYLSISSGDADGIFGPDGWSVDFWYKKDASTTSGGTGSFQDGIINQHGHFVIFDNTNQGVSTLAIAGSQDNTGSNFWSANTSTVTTTNWNHFHVGYDGTTVRVFVNGTLDNSVVTTSFHGPVTGGTATLNVGARSGGVGSAITEVLAGQLADVHIQTGTGGVQTTNFSIPTSTPSWTNDSVFLLYGSSSGWQNATSTTVTEAGTGNAVTTNTLPYSSGGGSSIAWGGDRAIIWGSNNGNNDGIAIDYFDITTPGNAADFGDVHRQVDGFGPGKYEGSCVSDTTYGVYAGGKSSFNANTTNQIDYITISTLGNSATFGNLTTNTHKRPASASDGTTGYFAGGQDDYNVTYYTGTDTITIATQGNATLSSFVLATGIQYTTGTQDTSRMLISGGYASANTNDDIMQYFTFASAGTAQSFGDLTVGRGQAAATSDNTYALIGGGQDRVGSTALQSTDVVTIQTAANATNFGNLTSAKRNLSAVSNGTYACFCGGWQSLVDIDRFTIATAGNATDFGDLVGGGEAPGACSGSAA